MDFRNKHLLGLYITVIYFVGPACAACKTLAEGQIYTILEQPPQKNVTAGDQLKPTIENIYDTFVSIRTEKCRSQIINYNITVN